MEKVSFREILEQKMGKNRSEKPLAENPANPFQQSVPEFLDRSLFLNVTRPNTLPQGRYPKTPSRAQNPLPKPPQNIFTLKDKEPAVRVKKSELSEISQTKWGRFEKMVEQSLGEFTSPEEVTRLFRSFLKRVHPDTNAGSPSGKHDFATLVKIKDEFLTEIKAEIKKRFNRQKARTPLEENLGAVPLSYFHPV